MVSHETAGAMVLAVSLGAAGALSGLTYRPLRHAATAVHEAGHAVVALLCGRRIEAIRLNADSSGETVSVGRSRGLGVLLTLLAGYPAPSLVGLVGVWAALHRHALGWALGLLVVLGAMLLLLRNVFGAVVLLAILGSLAAVVRSLGQQTAAPVVVGLATFLLVAGVRGVVELAQNGGRSSDSVSLARVTRVPAPVWTTVFLILTLGCALWGAAMVWRAVTPFLPGVESA